MTRLIQLPSPTVASPAVWINVDHITSATAIIEDAGSELRLLVELKLQGLPLSRHLVARGDREQLDAAWAALIATINDEGTQR